MADRYGGEPSGVLAFHGWGRSGKDWQATLEGLDALAVDLPGFGATPPPPGPWSVADYARLLKQQLTISHPAVIVGHSFGGRVAVRLAASDPDLVRGLILTGVPLVHPEASRSRVAMPYRLARSLVKHGMLPQIVVDRARQRYGSADYKSADGVMRGVLVKAVNEEYRDCLTSIRESAIPVALIWGRDDTVVPRSVAETAHALLGSESTLEYVPESGHLLDTNLARSIRKAIDRLLAGGREPDRVVSGVDAARIGADRVDAGRIGADRVDAGRMDAGRIDAGRMDAGRMDAGTVDASDQA